MVVRHHQRIGVLRRVVPDRAHLPVRCNRRLVNLVVEVKADQFAVDAFELVALIGGTIDAVLKWLDSKIRMSRAQFIEDLAAL